VNHLEVVRELTVAGWTAARIGREIGYSERTVVRMRTKLYEAGTLQRRAELEQSRRNAYRRSVDIATGKP
jgi:hypothetical protein